MNSKRIFFGMIGLVVLLSLGLLATVFIGNSMLQDRSKKLTDLKLENRLLDEQQIALVQANKDIDQYAELEKIAKAVVPQDKDQAKAVREIVLIADQAGVKLSAISFPASTLGQPTPKAAAPSSGDSEAPKTTAPATPPVTQVKPVDGIPGVFVSEINIQSDTANPVSYNKLINFLSRLEQNRRTAQVSSVTVQPNPLDRNKLTFNLVVNIYIKP